LAGASRIIAVEILEERQEMARELGAYVINPLEGNVVQSIKQITNEGADVCFEVTGIEKCLNEAIDSTKTDGQVVIVSVWEKTASISPNHFVLKERQLKGVLAYRNLFPAVIELISQGRLQVENLVTKKISLNNLTQEGFKELIQSKDNIKILVSPTLR
jgi:(R,R)-butanediol dehydrogenase/meso-butanediol dehydrogenase/diacetyl reductase